MALKAGYIGIKKSMLGLINSLGSAKIIKSFGDGLNLTSAGKLNLTAASASKMGGVKVGEGLSIENGVLSAAGGGLVYEEEKNKAGSVNGMTYYTQLIPFFEGGAAAPEWTQSGGNWINENFQAGDIDLILRSVIINETSGGAYSLTSGTVQFNNETGIWNLNFSTSYNTYIAIDYAVKEEE